MSLFLTNGGILTTVQDIGRSGFKRLGINPSGAMDKRAVRMINTILGNDENEAVLEMHFPAPALKFEKNATIAIGGADFAPKSYKSLIENWKTIQIKKNQTLSFSRKLSGNRAYLSVKGGFEIEKWLGSSSTNLQAKIGGFDGKKLEKGDRIEFRNTSAVPFSELKIARSSTSYICDNPTIRIIAGAEFDYLTGLSEEFFLNQEYTVSRFSDRMGFRLSGEPLHLLDEIELISSAVDFGTIQLLPDGQMIILMADHQTTGGYPRIAHVISADLPVLAQLGPHDLMRFELISVEEAEDLIINFERDLSFLKIGCKFSQTS